MTEDRRKAIEQIVSSKGEAMLCELEEIFPDISSMTLRRDLIYLEKMGIVRRTRGGAISVSRVSKPYEETFSKRAQREVVEKRAICRAALPFLEEGSTIFIDSGSTTMHFAQMAPDIHYLAVTTGPNIALELVTKAKPEVLLLGGRLRHNTLSVSGSWAMSALDGLNIDVAFMATSGFTSDKGFTSGSIEECDIKKEVLARAKTRVMMMDHTKNNRVLPFTFAHLEDMHYIVTNIHPEGEFSERAEKAHVKIIQAGGE